MYEEVELVDKAQVDRWLQAYVRAWKSYDRDQIGELLAFRWDTAWSR